jgi:hypothetical protein
MALIYVADSVSYLADELLGVIKCKFPSHDVYIDDFLSAINRIEDLSLRSTSTDVTVIIGTRQLELGRDFLNEIIEPNILSNANISLVLLTDFSSWAGANIPIDSDIEHSFTSRSPTSSSIELFAFENMFWQYSPYYQMKTFIFTAGLVYGSKGYDFSSILQSLWYKNAVEVHANERNIVPMIHINDLLNEFCTSLSAIVSNQIGSSRLIPLIDYNDRPIQEIIGNISSYCNGESSEIVFESSDRNVKVSGNWKCNLIFEKSIESLSLQRIDAVPITVLDEYIPFSNLRFVSGAVIGGPFYGKTAFGSLLAQRSRVLEVQAISRCVNTYIFFIG